MENKGTGNNAATSDFLQVLLALKQNTMRATNVAEVCRVDTENSCTIISSGESIEYISIRNLNFDKGDVILIIFPDTDFRSNLKRIQNGKDIQPIKQETLHTRNCGIAIGLIYKQ